MKNHYPATWWLMVVLTSLLAGALVMNKSFSGKERS